MNLRRILSIITLFLLGSASARGEITITLVPGQTYDPAKTSYSYNVVVTKPAPLVPGTMVYQGISYHIGVTNNFFYKVGGVVWGQTTGTVSVLVPGAEVLYTNVVQWYNTSTGAQSYSLSSAEAITYKNNVAVSVGRVPYPPGHPDAPPPSASVNVAWDDPQPLSASGEYVYRISFSGSHQSYADGTQVLHKLDIVGLDGETVLMTISEDVENLEIALPAGAKVELWAFDVKRWGDLWALQNSQTLPTPQTTDPDPGGENPGGENPGGENPGGENPGGENPGGENPGGENPGGENPGGENPGGENPGGEGDGKDYSGQLNAIKSELEKQTNQDAQQYEEEKTWRGDLMKELKDEDGAKQQAAREAAADEVSKAMSAVNVFAAEWGGKTFGSRLSVTGETTISTEGATPTNEWLFVVPIAGVSIDMNPINALQNWPGVATILAWLRRTVALVLAFCSARIVWGAVEKIQLLLQTQTESRGQTEVVLTLFGVGIATKSAAGLIKAGMYAGAFLLFGTMAWGYAADHGIVPSVGASLFASGAPAFGWAFFNLLFPMEMLGAFLVNAFAARTAVWLAGMSVSVVRQGVSTI